MPVADRLIIHFDGERAAWLDDRGALARGTPADAASAAGERPAVVLLPSEQILLTTVRLPPIRQARRRLQAARYALEDRLVSRVDSLHFALAARAGTDGETAVAVVDETLLRDHLDRLEEAGLDVLQLTADALTLPAPAEDQWQVLALDERVLARTDVRHAFAAEAGLWPALAAGGTPPARVLLHADSEAAAETAAAIDVEPKPAIDRKIFDGPDAALIWLLANVDLQHAINLRQGAFARTSAMQAWWQPFKITAGLAAAWLIVAIAARGIESWQLGSRIDGLEATTESAFRDAFPDVQTINDVRVQAEQRIGELRGSGGSGGVFALLQAIAEVTGDAGDIRIQSLQYRDGAVYLNLRGENVQALESLRAGFARQPATRLSVESADAAADGVQIRARVSGAEA